MTSSTTTPPDETDARGISRLEKTGSHLRGTSPKPEAFGDNLPENYFRSPRFLGSVAVSPCHSMYKVLSNYL